MKKIYYLLLFIVPLLPCSHLAAQQINQQGWQNTASGKTNSGSITVEAFGAVGNEVTDDTKAFQSAFAYAQAHGLSAVDLGSGKKYKISNSINIDYRGQGQLDRKGIQLNGNGASIFLASGSGGPGYYAINIITDDKPQQNTRFNINNIWFYTDNRARPNGIYNNHACFVTIDNCVFYQLATAIKFEKAGMCRFDNCFFWGCVEGITTYSCKDSYIDGCHAFACDQGYNLTGMNNSGSDGNICIVNSVANASTQFNLKMKGLYTPIISNCVFEQSPVNLSIEACSFGKMNDVFSGPGTVEFISTPGEQTNDYWNISNIDVQGKVVLNGLKFSNITGFNVHGIGSSGNTANAAIQLNNCYEDNFTAITSRDSRDGLAWSLYISPDCSSLTISNLIADRSIFLKGTSSQRPGRFILSTSIINGAILTEDNHYKSTEIFDFVDSGSNTYHSNKPGK